mmetsp:Transcript_1969/g.2922  ORF Transcript_1969/g.2922 Transcript_1969/m.2922 type:complete len:151 (-) Transcript_1969:4705-5157(-)
MGPVLDVAKVFSVDYDSDIAVKNFIGALPNSDRRLGDSQTPPFKFVYSVENEKIISSKMFFVEQQRKDFSTKLSNILTNLKNYIQRKYKNCSSTKIGFSSEKELYNILHKMLSAQKGFFDQIIVRKILSQFWLTIREVLDTIKIKRFQGN